MQGAWLAIFFLLALLAYSAAYFLVRDALLPWALRGLCAVAGGLAFESLRRGIRPDAPSDAHGSARFDSPPRLWLGSGESGAVRLGHHRSHLVSLPRHEALRHGFILGPSGSGKSFGFFLPNAARSVGTSCVFTDPKGELWHRTAGLHPTALRFAPGEPDQSAAFNWVPLCRDARMAELISRAIVMSGNTQRTEQVWLDLEAGFLSALFAHAATLEEPTPLSAYYLFTRQRPEALQLQLETSHSPVAREQANILKQTSERMRGSIVPVVAARLQFLRDPAVARFTSSVREAPQFASLRTSPQALYWCLREQDVTRLRPLSAAFFTVLIEQLIAGSGTGESSVPVTLYLDEFAAVGPIPDFDTLIALARGRGISIWLGLQSLAQLEGRYGKSAAQTILTNCGTKLVLSGLDFESAQYISRSLGDQTRRTRRRTWHYPFLALASSSRTMGDGEHARPLLTPDEVRRLPEDRLLTIALNQPPLYLERRIYAVPPVTRRAGTLGAARSTILPGPSLSSDLD